MQCREDRECKGKGSKGGRCGSVCKNGMHACRQVAGRHDGAVSMAYEKVAKCQTHAGPFSLVSKSEAAGMLEKKKFTAVQSARAHAMQQHGGEEGGEGGETDGRRGGKRVVVVVVVVGVR